jgi:hypothetical protein
MIRRSSRSRPFASRASLALVALLVGCRRDGVAVRAAPRVGVTSDVDGDGLGDVVLSDAPLGALLLRGSRARPLTEVRWRWSVSAADPARVRVASVVLAGDLDRDGRAEVALSETSVTDDPCARGGVRVHRGGTAGVSPLPAWRLEDATAADARTHHYARVGAHLARVDGLDGPGSFGLIVSARRTRVTDGSSSDGAPHAAAGSSEFCQGDELWVYHGTSRTPGQRIVIGEGEVQRVVTGRIDGDAFSDLFVLAPPKGLLFRGRRGGFEERPSATLVDPHDDPQRWSDAAIGDLDGDGDGEVIVTTQYSSEGAQRGRVAVVHYDVFSHAPRVAAMYALGERASGGAPRSVVVLSDLDGDRRSEVVVADPSQRAALLFLGRTEPRWASPDRVLRASESDGTLGVTLINAGDVDGDGRDEVLVRAEREDGAMATLHLGWPLRGTLERVTLPPGPQGFGWALAGRSANTGGSRPRELPPLPRRCRVPSAEREPERLVAVGAPRVAADGPRIAEALRERVRALALCQQRALEEDCSRASRASISLGRDDAGALSVAGVAWLDPTTDALRDCVQSALGGPLLDASAPGSDGPVELRFLEVP